MHSHAVVLLLACAPLCIVSFCPTPHTRPACVWSAARTGESPVHMKKTWSKRETLAEKAGGAADKGAAAVGLEGTIPVEFEQGGELSTTMAIAGQPLSEVCRTTWKP